MQRTYEVTIKVTVKPFETVDGDYIPTPDDVEDLIMDLLRNNMRQPSPKFNVALTDFGVETVTRRYRGL